MYHPQYGYADENKKAYNQAKLDCMKLSYEVYPPKDFYIPEVYEPRTSGGSSWGSAYAYGKAKYESMQARQMALDIMHEYNKARDEYFNMCIQKEGWIEVEVEEELF